MPAFCRHNRFVQNCPICARDQAPPGLAPAGGGDVRPARTRSSTATRSPARSGRSRGSGGVIVRRAARAADDGYRSSLVPGIRGSADAERLAVLVAREDELLVALAVEPPPPWDAVAEAPDVAQAAERALRIVLGVGDGEPSEAAARTLTAYATWLERHGGAEAAFVGDDAWTPKRRFGRLFERLSLPGFGRAERFRLLTVLGASGRIAVEAASLHFGATGDDPATLAAKRVLSSGDPLLLDSRAAALADALGVPLATLDGALAAFEAGERPDADDLEGPTLRRLRGALGV